MSKVRIQNQLRKLDRLQKEREIADLPAALKDCILNEKTPKNPRIRELVRLIEDSYYVAVCAGVLPSMPAPPPAPSPIQELKQSKPKPSVIKGE